MSTREPATVVLGATGYLGGLAAAALLGEDLAKILATVQDGLKSAQHQEFVARLGTAQ